MINLDKKEVIKLIREIEGDVADYFEVQLNINDYFYKFSFDYDHLISLSITDVEEDMEKTFFFKTSYENYCDFNHETSPKGFREHIIKWIENKWDIHHLGGKNG